MEELSTRHITINVGGKIYATTVSTVEVWPNTMLAMLLRHTCHELFIDRDGKMFRWILHWYRTGVLVDHQTVGVPEEVWKHELQFYGIGEEEMVLAEQRGGQNLGEMSEKRRKLDNEEQSLQDKAKDALDRAKAKDKERELDRRQCYVNLLAYMIDHLQSQNENSTTNFTFVGPTKSHSHDFVYPDAYDTRARINPLWFLKGYYKNDFVHYCEALGFAVKLVSGNSCTSLRKWEHLPASLTDIHREKSFVTIQIAAAPQQ